MKDIKQIRLLACSLITSLILSGTAVSCALAQVNGPIPLPPAKPRIDQLGQMTGVPEVDQSLLAIGLFLQLIACIAVAIALAGHLAMPKKAAK